VQAHILGEVSILGSTLLRVYSWAILPIFILTQGQTILAELASPRSACASLWKQPSDVKEVGYAYTVLISSNTAIYDKKLDSYSAKKNKLLKSEPVLI